MIGLQELQVFVTVVQAGSFTAAARKLDLPKSSVSRKVSALEKRLGLRLLHRTTRSLTLTEPGEIYYERAARITAELLDLENLVSGFTEAPLGTLRITCPTGFVESNEDMFTEFMNRFEEVQLQVQESDVFVDIVKEGFDIAFRGGKAPDPSLTGLKLKSAASHLVASPAYLEQRGRPSRLKELHQHDLVLLSGTPRAKLTLSNGRQEAEMEVVGRVRTTSMRCVHRFVAAGLGIGLLPPSSRSLDSERQELERVLPEWCGSPAELWLVYPTERQMASAVRAFLDMASEWDFELF